MPSPGALETAVTSAEVAANVRAITVHIDGVRSDDAAVRDLLARIDTIVRLFLEKHWTPPRRIAAVQPLSYVLFQAPDDPGFAADVERLREELQKRLYGDDDAERIDVKAVVGPRSEIERLAEGDELRFISVLGDADVIITDDGGDDRASLELAPPRSVPWRERFQLYAGYSAPRDAIVSYVVMLSRGDSRNTPIRHEDAPLVLADEAADFKTEEFELAALDFAAAKVAEQARIGAVSYCLVPLSYATLTDRRRRDAYLAQVARYDKAVVRFLVPSVFGGPQRPASSFLVDLAGRLRRRFSFVDWRTDSCSLALEPFEPTRLFGVTLIPAKGRDDFGVELERLPAFFRKARAMRLPRGIAGVTRRGDVDAAIRAGVQFLSGPAISGAMPSLAPRVEIDVDALPVSEEAEQGAWSDRRRSA